MWVLIRREAQNVYTEEHMLWVLIKAALDLSCTSNEYPLDRVSPSYVFVEE